MYVYWFSSESGYRRRRRRRRQRRMPQVHRATYRQLTVHTWTAGPVPFQRDSINARLTTTAITTTTTKTIPPKVIWEERVALAQLRNKVSIGYNETPHIYPKTSPSPSTITTPI